MEKSEKAQVLLKRMGKLSPQDLKLVLEEAKKDLSSKLQQEEFDRIIKTEEVANSSSGRKLAKRFEKIIGDVTVKQKLKLEVDVEITETATIFNCEDLELDNYHVKIIKLTTTPTLPDVNIEELEHFFSSYIRAELQHPTFVKRQEELKKFKNDLTIFEKEENLTLGSLWKHFQELYSD